MMISTGWGLLLLLLLHGAFLSACSAAAQPANSSLLLQMTNSYGPASSVDFNILTIGAPITFSARDAACFAQASHLFNGWTLFVQWLNEERGGVLMGGAGAGVAWPLQLVAVEDYSTEEYASRAAATLVSNYSAHVFFGPCSSPLTTAAMAVTEPARLLLLSASSLHDLPCNKSSLLVALQPATDTYTLALFDTLRSLGAESVAFVVDDVADSHCVNASLMRVIAMQHNISLLGYDVVDQARYDASLRAILQAAQASDADVVVGCPLRDVASAPEQQIRGVCVQLPLVSRNLSFSPKGLLFAHCNFDDPIAAGSLGSAAAHLLTLAPWHPSAAIVDSASASGWSAAEFRDNYVAQFKVEPTYHAAAAFASGTLLQLALEALALPTTEYAGPPLANAFKTSGSHFPSVFGNVSFGECGESAMPLLVLQAQGGQALSVVVFPAQYLSGPLVYPAPSWNTRNCEEDTASCAGHGACSVAGVCECEENYYGLENSLSCDGFCTGEIVDGFCITSQTFYIGGTFAAMFPEHTEHIAHMRHAIDLINNKTDGWFDEEMAQVQMVLQLEDSGCAADVAEGALELLQEWTLTESQGADSLTAVVGAFCSGASMSIATQANIANFFQISYASTNEALSNVNQYRYFTRTAPSDAIQGPLLAKSLIELGVTPFIAVVHLIDGYSASLASSIIQKYQESGQYYVLLTLSFDSDATSDEDYHDIIFRVGESGCAAIVFVGYQDIALKVFEAAALHPVLGSSEVLWVGIDAWTGLLLHDTVPIGVVGITPKVAHTPVTADYLARWAALPPEEYPSLNGEDREILATYSATLVDATVALGLTLQLAIENNKDFSGATLFDEITSNVQFEGVSGKVHFDTAGDLKHPAFSLSNYQTRKEEDSGDGSIGEWVVVGNVTETSFFVVEDSLQWPGGAENASSFSKQLIPWCAAGSEPLLTFATGISSCSPCKVGYYKSADGRSSCLACPEGAMCDDTGIAIPCVEYGYWRDPIASEIGEGDFSKFEIFRCEVHDVCRGGCELNNSCAPSRQRTAPVCGTCTVDMYMADHECFACSKDNMDESTFRLLIYLFVTLGLVILLSLILFVNLLTTPTTPKAKKQGSDDVFISMHLINAMQGSKDRHHQRALTMQDGDEDEPTFDVKMEMELEMTTSVEQKGDRMKGSGGMHEPSQSDDDEVSSKLVLEGSVVGWLLRHKNGLKKFVRGASITGKITLSFLQVITGSFLTLNLNHPEYLHQFHLDLHINPLQPIESSFKCAEQSGYSDDMEDDSVAGSVFFVSILLSVLCPIYFLLTLLLSILISRVAYFTLVYPKKRALVQNKRQFVSRQFSKMYNLSIKLYIWFCLIMYPVLSANILAVFNCRDLGFSGIFLRGDYAINCESDSYLATRVVAIVGIFFIPIGVPLLFAALIFNRNNKWLKQPSFFLHGNFIPSWRYFEVLDLLRKLVLTSLVPYVGEVDSTTQCLFLLVVDSTFLVVLAYTKPYQNTRDDFLSLVLITTECAAFLLGVVVISGIDKDDNYHTNALYACLYAWFLVDLVVVMPLSLAAKSTAVSRGMDKWRAAVAGLPGLLRARQAGGAAPTPSGGMGDAASRVTDNPLHN